MEDTNTHNLSRPEKRGVAECPYLMVIAGRRLGEVYKLTSARTVVGRSPDAALRLDDDGISREHTELMFVNGRLRLRDLGSTNGTFINGERAGTNELHNGDQVSIGTTTLLVFTHDDGLDRGVIRGHARALRDPETSALRREAFVERLAEEISFSRRRGAPLALLAWELDGFATQDPRVSPETRRLLGAVARLAAEALPEDDIFGDFGPGRFGVACRETTTEQARVRAELLRAAFAAKPIETGSERVSVTISVGVALAGPIADRTGQAAAALMRAAEAAIAVARARGGDRVELATAPTARS